jgi:CRP/FNR family nitrogen fixation transcriptional regulator
MCLGNSNSRDRELVVSDGDGWISTPSIDHDPLESIGTVVSLTRNRELYAHGDPAAHLYKMISGAVRTCKYFSDGRRQIGAFYLAGDVFGLQMDIAHTLSAEAINSSRVLVIPRPALMALAERDNDVALRLWSLTTRELRRTHDHVLLLMKTAPERVASFLLAIAERVGTSSSVDLPMPRRDIADYLGLTMETVSRTLSDLQAAGTIKLPRSQRIVFSNRTALERLKS